MAKEKISRNGGPTMQENDSYINAKPIVTTHSEKEAVKSPLDWLHRILELI